MVILSGGCVLVTLDRELNQFSYRIRVNRPGRHSAAGSNQREKVSKVKNK